MNSNPRANKKPIFIVDPILTLVLGFERVMALAAPGQLNVIESPSRGSRSVDCFEKLEQIGEGTYGSVFRFALPIDSLLIWNYVICDLTQWFSMKLCDM